MRAAILLVLFGFCCRSAQSDAETCSKRPLFNDMGPPTIIGRQPAKPGAWPWQISFQWNNFHTCGATIISKAWVLTTTTCFRRSSCLEAWRLVAGITDTNAKEENSQIVKVKKTIFHSEPWNNDIVLLQIWPPFNFTDYVQPICMLENEELEFSFTHCYISGWGIRDESVDTFPHRLQEAQVELINSFTCNQSDWNNGSVTFEMLCAGKKEGKIGSCGRDEGGPLQCYHEKENKFYLLGLTSGGIGCAKPKQPALYTRISKFYKWIMDSQQTYRVKEDECEIQFFPES
ncbi:acrosin-like [Erpetoichthys calabaricus]|uniref:acrosin-like n=1 Tax=Erpetoichthys calabaricus TaxID=27687 RepID=UPI00109FA93E|nr:acrosin-like [Erpetoichthys calabaricus]